MSRRKPCVVVLGGSSSTHARIPAQMARDAGYRVVLANTEHALAPGTLDFFDAVHSVITSTERAVLLGRAIVATREPERPIKPMEILTPTRKKSLYGRLLLGWQRGCALARVVHREQAGLLHIQGMDVGAMAAYYYLKRVGFGPERHPPVIAHLFSYQPRFPELRRREMRLLAACAYVHTSSPVVARIYLEHYAVPATRLSVLVRGINLETFAPREPAALAAARHAWGVPADKFVLIHNRHLHPMYRVDVAVDAFIELARRGHDVFLMLVRGSMWEKEYEEQMLARLAPHGLHDRIALLPHVLNAGEMATALQLAHCSINTVPFDAFPVSILESMYCRAVPVVRDLESYGLFVREGETGFLCAGTGPEQYVEKIERLIRNPDLRTRMAAQGVARVAADGDVAIYRRRLLDMYGRFYRDT